MCAKFISRTVVAAVIALSFSAAANAAILDLAAGTLQLGTTNNEFLLEFGLDGNGLETPYPAFLSNGSNLSVGSQSTSYQQSSNPSFTFDFSFSVAQDAIISQNASYSTFVGSATSSVSLLQGTNVIDTGIQTGPGFGENYFLPAVILQPNTQYDLVVTTLGVPSSDDAGFSGTQGWGQIAVDVSAVPEPGIISLLAAGSLLGFSSRGMQRRAN
ncbi:MAG TPA: hypothetical protein VGG19_16915 [Tepidisphaeraceae bacterium]